MNAIRLRPLLAVATGTGLLAGTAVAAAAITPGFAAPAPPAATLLDDAPGDPEPNGPPCADVDGNGIVGFPDLLIVLESFQSGDLAGDVNMSGGIEFADIVLTLVQWGGSCS